MFQLLTARELFKLSHNWDIQFHSTFTLLICNIIFQMWIAKKVFFCYGNLSRFYTLFIKNMNFLYLKFVNRPNELPISLITNFSGIQYTTRKWEQLTTTNFLQRQVLLTPIIKERWVHWFFSLLKLILGKNI